MKTKELFAGLALTLLLSAGAYAQTTAGQCCPAGVAKPAETEGAGRGPQLAWAEGAGPNAKTADTEGYTDRPKLADSEGYSPRPKLASADAAGTVTTTASGTPCPPCP